VNLGSPIAEILAGLLAFLIGGVPFGWLYARVVKHVDLRSIGSGNVGATNAARLYTGRKAVLTFLLIFVLDAAKGFAAAWFAHVLGRFLGAAATPNTMAVVCGSSAILGHVYTPYLGFKGGKGVATALGVVTALATWQAIYAVGMWGVLVAFTRYVSLGSIGAMLTIPLTYFMKYGDESFHARFGVFAFLTVCTGIVVWRHRENIRRLLAGRERKIGTGTPAAGA
jgi:glycerol-3-phosphate acyltransferase PlsY